MLELISVLNNKMGDLFSDEISERKIIRSPNRLDSA